MRSFRLALPLSLVLLTACVTTTDRVDGLDMTKTNVTAQAHIREQVNEMRFMHDQELMQRMVQLARLGEDATPAVVEGTKSDDWLVRLSCHWVLYAMGDRRNIPAIQAGLADPVPAVRYQAASALVKLGDARGFRALVDGLADSDLQSRFKCFQALREATGKDFGYRHDGAPEERRQAVGRWLDWLDGIKSSAL